MLESPKCVKCGICKSVCPVYKELLDERFSPRGIHTIEDENITDKAFYFCTLCKACEKVCPAKVKMEFSAARAKISKKMQTTANKEMIKHVKEVGNPFGKLEKGEQPKKLYCC